MRIYNIFLLSILFIYHEYAFGKNFSERKNVNNFLSRPAKELFGHVSDSAPMAPRSIGSYAKGCLAGGEMLPINGPGWQAMRLSRNRNWGHPELISYIKSLAGYVKKNTKWNGLLVGDIAQPRGGPMLTGHASHQIGLDADIWLKSSPNKILSKEEREKISAISVLNRSRKSINESVWTEDHFKIINRAASYSGVARIFVHPVIKERLCQMAKGDRSWLNKVRPWYGHHYHFHVRFRCPEGSINCKNQSLPPPREMAAVKSCVGGLVMSHIKNLRMQNQGSQSLL